ncbi:MAG: DUF423 domain-containing protein [Nitrospinota bacterium]
MNMYFGVASLFAFSSVALGAFGAHMVKPHISITAMTTYQTGIKYLMFNSMALFVCAFGLHTCSQEKRFRKAFHLFVYGGVIFSGSLFFIAISGVRPVGMITPVGGVIQLYGWIVLATIGLKGKKNEL